MRITDKQIYPEEAQGQILLQTSGVSRLTVDGSGGFGYAAIQSATATTGTFTAGSGTSSVSGSSWVGTTGTKSYSVSDIVTALKNVGILSP